MNFFFFFTTLELPVPFTRPPHNIHNQAKKEKENMNHPATPKKKQQHEITASVHRKHIHLRHPST